MSNPDHRITYHPDTIHRLIAYLKDRHHALSRQLDDMGKKPTNSPLPPTATVPAQRIQASIETIEGALEAILQIEIENSKERLERALGLD